MNLEIFKTYSVELLKAIRVEFASHGPSTVQWSQLKYIDQLILEKSKKD